MSKQLHLDTGEIEVCQLVSFFRKKT